MYSLGTPAADLQPFIDRYWFVTCAPGQTFRLSVDVYVDAQADLVINHGVPYERVAVDGSITVIPWSSIDAQRTRPVVIRQEGRVRVCGARFRPGGLAAFTPHRMDTLTDLVVPVSDVLGVGAGSLEQELGNLETDQQARCTALDEFFRARRRDDSAYEGFLLLLAEVEGALPGELTVRVLARECGISVRGVQRLFARFLGLSPRVYLRIARFQRAMRSMMDNPDCELADVAVTAGYYDQSHLVREFRELAGDIPRNYKGYLPETGRDFAPNVVRYERPLRRQPDADDRAGNDRKDQIKGEIDQC